VDSLGAYVHHRRVPGEVECERGRIAVDDAEPEPRLVERAREIVDERAVGLARLHTGGGEGHELREALELDACGELSAEVSLEVLEEDFDERAERQWIDAVGSARLVMRKRRQAAEGANLLGTAPEPLVGGTLDLAGAYRRSHPRAR
jgi:hypothetical protein